MRIPNTEACVDGYLNENGVINTNRLQVILDEMAEWEREVFEKEFADINWYKGKQAKHVKEMELARKRSKLGANVLNFLPLLVLSFPSSFDDVAEGHIRPGEGIRPAAA